MKINRKPFYLVLIFLLFFTGFIYLLTRPSIRSAAVDELGSCYTVEDVKICWDKFRTDLHTDEEFVQAVREKLSSFNLSEDEMIQCKKWLPKPRLNLNLIVVPDLSKRIIDESNNPGQVTNDTTLLNHIYRTFMAVTRVKSNSKDRLIIDVTDEGQAGGNFRSLANELIFDLAQHKNQSNRLYFNKVKDRFNVNIRKLYELARTEPIGADFWYYFNRHLGKRIQKSTLFDDYRNVLVLITDGYLEAQTTEKTGVSLYTGSFTQRVIACQQIRKGKMIDKVLGSTLPKISDCQQHFPNLEVLVLEVNERKGRSKMEPKDPGTPCDYELLKNIWTDWFKTLEIKNANQVFFIQRNDATALTVNEINNFLILNK